MPNGKAAGFVSLPVILLVELGFVFGCSEFIMLGVEPDISASLGVPLASVGNLVGLFAGIFAVCTPALGIATGHARRFTLLVNSIALAVDDGSTMTLGGTSLSATSEGSNAIFSADGATVYVNGGTLSTAGSGSPLLYSTGDVQVTDVTGTATGSQIAGMEGLSTILINDSTLESAITDKTASNPVANGVIIYQSTSGDVESTTGETATFQAADSALKSAIQSGSMFYFTNTSADVVLSNTTLVFDSSAADLILASGNDANNWGSAGSNGATVKFTGIGQTLGGTVEADAISSVDLHLTQGSTWTDSARITQNSAGSTSDAPRKETHHEDRSRRSQRHGRPVHHQGGRRPVHGRVPAGRRRAHDQRGRRLVHLLRRLRRRHARRGRAHRLRRPRPRAHLGPRQVAGQRHSPHNRAGARGARAGRARVTLGHIGGLS